MKKSSDILVSALHYLLHLSGVFAVVLIAVITVDGKWSSVLRRVAPEPAPQGITVPSGVTADVISALQDGGHTIFVRHATQDDRDANPFDRFSTLAGGEGYSASITGECINDLGRAEAWLIGKAFELAKIPVGTVYSSPICRARETAELAFGRIDVIDQTLNYQGLSADVSEEERTRSAESFRSLIAESPEPGSNRVLVAHRAMFSDAGGFGWQDFRLEKSGMLIIRHEENGGITPVARTTLKQIVFSLPAPIRDDLFPSRRPQLSDSRR